MEVIIARVQSGSFIAETFVGWSVVYGFGGVAYHLLPIITFWHHFSIDKASILAQLGESKTNAGLMLPYIDD